MKVVAAAAHLGICWPANVVEWLEHPCYANAGRVGMYPFPAADEILREKDVYIIPDVMANAGGVVVSYFECVQNLQHFRWDEREVNDKLGTIMRRAYREVSARAREEGIDVREAAYLVGIERVVEAARTRGYV